MIYINRFPARPLRVRGSAIRKKRSNNDAPEFASSRDSRHGLRVCLTIHRLSRVRFFASVE